MPKINIPGLTFPPTPSRTFRLPCIHAQWPHSSNSSAGLFPPYPSLSFYGQKSTWPARRKGVVEMEKKVRWGKGGGRWKKPLSITVWHRPFSFRRHSLPVRLFLWSASTKRSFTCSPPREGKIPSLTPARFGFWRFPIRNFHIYLFSFAGFFLNFIFYFREKSCIIKRMSMCALQLKFKPEFCSEI